MISTSALLGGAMGAGIHALANSIAKKPIARYPWMYVVLGGTGAYLVPYMDETVAEAKRVAVIKQEEKMEKNFKF